MLPVSGFAAPGRVTRGKLVHRMATFSDTRSHSRDRCALNSFSFRAKVVRTVGPLSAETVPMGRDLPIFVSVILATIVAGLLVAGLVRILWHTRQLPRCWNCGFQKVRPSRSRRTRDRFARLLVLRPQRCEGCQERFYCFGHDRAPRRHRSAFAASAR
jgi:hypothetical protein